MDRNHSHREIGHGDTERDWQAVVEVAAHLEYSQDQLNAALDEAAARYADDRGAALLSTAFD